MAVNLIDSAEPGKENKPIRITFVSHVDELNRILSDFESIGLSEMQNVELMDRTDTKFIVSLPDLHRLLYAMRSHYRILEVLGNRTSKYDTLYFDTASWRFYTSQQNGKLNRVKVRMREYVESQLNFLEVKFKTNKDKTKKYRMPIAGITMELTGAELDFVRQHTGESLNLVPRLWNSFERITLVNLHWKERITIDLSLSFRDMHGNQRSLNHIAIIEVKQQRQNRLSPFAEALHAAHIRPEGISKYCVGVSLLYDGIKKNMYKEKLRNINNLELQHAR